MSDATRLRLALRDYLQCLDAYRGRLRDEHAVLRSSWAMTRDVYRGDGADVFEESFRKATGMVEDYLRAADLISVEMVSRLESLEAFDARSDGAE